MFRLWGVSMSSTEGATDVRSARPRKSITVRRVLALVVGAIWLVLTIPALGLAAMSVMASDGGVNAAIYTFVFACFALPLTTLLAAVGGFVSGVTGRMRFVAIGSALPFVALAVAFGAIAFGAGAAPAT
jgi:hypothetical protein